MNYKINIRKEFFGATVLNLSTGKRRYISNDEFEKIFCKYPIIYENVEYSKNEIKLTSKNNDNFFEGFMFADVVFLEVTRACNLRCSHCLNNSGERLINQLSKDDFKKLIYKLAEAGVQEIRFTGGEPLVFPGIYDLIYLATSLGIYVSIGTNGTLIDKNVAIKLKNSGLKKAVLSLDGNKETHDIIRGKGSFDKTFKAIEFLSFHKIDLKINTVLMRSNMDDVISFAKSIGKAGYDLFIRRFIESGRGIMMKNNVLSAADYAYVYKELRESLDSYPNIRGHYLRNRCVDGKSIVPFELSGGCKAGQRSFVITPNGDIHLCGFLASQGFPPVGNINDINDFSEFWFELQNRNILNNLREKLDIYNEQWGVQKTNCLAYVQNMENVKKKIQKQKNFKIIISKYNMYTGQIEKLRNESLLHVEVIEIEKLFKSKDISHFNENSIVYFVCCNSTLIPSIIELLSTIKLKIINKKFLSIGMSKIEIQQRLSDCQINVPKIYCNHIYLNNKFPIMCKENKHQGKIFEIFNQQSLDEFIRKMYIKDYYFEESINLNTMNCIEYKIYYIKGKIFCNYDINNNVLYKMLNMVSNILFNLDVFSVDIIKKNDIFYVIDVNTSVGFYSNNNARKYFLENYLLEE